MPVAPCCGPRIGPCELWPGRSVEKIGFATNSDESPAGSADGYTGRPAAEAHIGIVPG